MEPADLKSFFAQPMPPRYDWELIPFLFFEPQRFRKQASFRILFIFFAFITIGFIITYGLNWQTLKQHLWGGAVIGAIVGIVLSWRSRALDLILVGLFMGIVGSFVLSVWGALGMGVFLGFVFILIDDPQIESPETIITLLTFFFLGCIFGILFQSMPLIGHFWDSSGERVDWNHWWMGVGKINLGFVAIALNLWNYPFQVLKSRLQKNDFFNNVYLTNGWMVLPMPRLRVELLEKALERPDVALLFVELLRRNRLYQRLLAYEMLHIALPQCWLKATQLTHNLLNDRVFCRPEQPAEAPYFPSQTWHDSLNDLQKQLRLLPFCHEPIPRKRCLQKCLQTLESLKQQHSLELFDGKTNYEPIWAHWELLLKDPIAKISMAAPLSNEVILVSITNNQQLDFNPILEPPFLLEHDALVPKPEKTQAFDLKLRLETVFGLEREPLLGFLTETMTANAPLPLFWVVGQPYIGKAFFIETLAKRLGDDTRIIEWICDFKARWMFQQVWLQLLQNDGLPKSHRQLNFSNQFLESWILLEKLLDEWAAENPHRKLIFVIKQYESFLGGLAHYPEDGADLLAQLRTFAARQHQILFIFSGLKTWGGDLTGFQRVSLGYLSETTTIQYLKTAAEPLKVHYAPNVLKWVWEQTQGHPYFVSVIASFLMDYAERRSVQKIHLHDLNYFLKRQIVLKNSPPFALFWRNVANSKEMRLFLRRLARAHTRETTHETISFLKETGYIVENEQVGLQIRMPLLRRWIQLFGSS
jgi:hypothetical protein